jgi:tRNA pseudouridine32 synthase/23S rRNA pseudouridine746 synthase/23S rRNA pseudouridine1911/1915/1917 synthase
MSGSLKGGFKARILAFFSFFWHPILLMRVTLSEPTSLLAALAVLSPESSRRTLRLWVAQGRVQVDGVVVRREQTVRPGQEVRVGNKVQFAARGIEILYEDRDLAVIQKPAGLLSVATDYTAHETAHACLKKRRYPRRVYPVHRLDRETSGVMLFAYAEEARAHLKEQFAVHSVDRVYVALVEGVLQEASGTWRSRLWENAAYVVRSTCDPERGREAVTHYEVIRVQGAYTLVRFTLETGRKNQIRVHCQEAGHPIAGDVKYGATTNPLGRLALHAHYLAFTHPRTGRRISFSSPAPY